jgi:hypothetical protein
MNIASDITLTQQYLTAQTRVNERQARVHPPLHPLPPSHFYHPYAALSASSGRSRRNGDRGGPPAHSPSVEFLGVRAPDGRWVKQEEDEENTYAYLRDTESTVVEESPEEVDYS